MTQNQLDYIPNDIVALEDYERYAKKIMDKNSLSYVTSGAADEITMRKNCQDFNQIFLEGKPLENLKGAHTKISLFNKEYDSPIMLAPVAYQKLVDSVGEINTIRAANALNSCMIVSSFASSTIEEISQNATAPLWFQLYMQEDMSANLELIKKAENLDYEALVITIDAPIAGIRNKEQRTGFHLPKDISAVNIKKIPISQENNLEGVLSVCNNLPTWDDIEYIKKNTKLPVILKGITSIAYAEKALHLNIDGIIVSNHGGRTLDTLPSTIEILPKISKAVDKKMKVFLDGGIRRGSDILKAIALGADAVMIGRPIMYGLATAGALGVAHTLKILQEELEASMVFTGCKDIEKIKKLNIINNNYHYC